jgi:hypothetical protein
MAYYTFTNGRRNTSQDRRILRLVHAASRRIAPPGEGLNQELHLEIATKELELE